MFKLNRSILKKQDNEFVQVQLLFIKSF